MHANLVRAPRLQRAADVRRETEAGDHRDPRDGALALANTRGEAEAIDRVPAVEGVVLEDRDLTDGDCVVLALHSVRGELRLQMLPRVGGARDDEQPARSFVDAVDDARSVVPFGVAWIGELARRAVRSARLAWRRGEVAAREEAVHERPSGVALRRVNDEPRRLVHYDERVIGVHDVERDPVLGERARRWGLRASNRDEVPCTKMVRRLARRAVDEHRPEPDPALHLGARRRLRQSRQSPLHELIEPQPALRLPYDELLLPLNRACRARACRDKDAYQIFDLMCPLAFTSMSTSARS